MKKLIILGLVLLMVVVFATTVFGAAQKLELISDNPSYLHTNPEPEGDVVGFVILNNPDPVEEGYNLTIVISLKEGIIVKQVQANGYGVFLERYDENFDFISCHYPLTLGEGHRGF